MSRLSCQSCGANVEVPAEHARPRIRCGDCGYYVDVPAELRGVKNEEPVATVTRAKAKKKSEIPPLLVGTQDEDDEKPYSVPGDPYKKCAECFKEIDYHATFCVHCGSDFTSGKKKKKTFEPIDRFYEEYYPRSLRLKGFLGLQVLNLLIGFTMGSFEGAIAFMAMQGGLQAFLIGTYSTLRVTRTSKGSGTIVRQRFFFFYPGPAEKLDHKVSQGVGIIAINQPGIIDWITFIYLLLCGILPGVLFYWFVMRPDRFHVSLCDVYGSTNDIAFRTTDREVAVEICETIRDATSLWYKPVL